MDSDRGTLVYKNSNWAERKRELKSTRNQRTSKSIRNIRAIDTPADPTFNCTSHSTQTQLLRQPHQQGRP